MTLGLEYSSEINFSPLFRDISQTRNCIFFWFQDWMDSSPEGNGFFMSRGISQSRYRIFPGLMIGFQPRGGSIPGLDSSPEAFH